MTAQNVNVPNHSSTQGKVKPTTMAEKGCRDVYMSQFLYLFVVESVLIGYGTRLINPDVYVYWLKL